MKILANATPNNTYGDFKDAVVHNGHEWIWWSEHKIPTFDVFDEIKPNIVFCMSMDNAIVSCVSEYKTPLILGYKEDYKRFFLKTEQKKKIYNFDYLVNDLFFKPEKIYPFQTPVAKVLCVCKPNDIIQKICYETKQNIKIMHEEKWNIINYIGIPSKNDKKIGYNYSPYVFVDNEIECMRVISCEGGLPITTDNNLSKSFDSLLPVIESIEDFDDMIHNFNNNKELYYSLVNRLSEKYKIEQYTYNFAFKQIMEFFNNA